MANSRSALFFGITVVITAFGASAEAGARWNITTQVYTNQGSGFMSGAIGNARNSANPNEYIYCTVERFYDPSSTASPFGTIFCGAHSGTTSANCYVGETNLDVFARVLATVTDDSLLDIRFRNGQCTYIAVTNGSLTDRKL